MIFLNKLTQALLDETYSTTYIYGSNLVEIIDSKILSVSELQKYQRFNPDESLFESFGRIIRGNYPERPNAWKVSVP
jgi:hypothetical protein